MKFPRWALIKHICYEFAVSLEMKLCNVTDLIAKSLQVRTKRYFIKSKCAHKCQHFLHVYLYRISIFEFATRSLWTTSWMSFWTSDNKILKIFSNQWFFEITPAWFRYCVLKRHFALLSFCIRYCWFNLSVLFFICRSRNPFYNSFSG